MNKEVRLIMITDSWVDVDYILKLLKKTINAAYDACGITGKEYLIMEDFRKDAVDRFGDKEEDNEDCD